LVNKTPDKIELLLLVKMENISGSDN